MRRHVCVLAVPLLALPTDTPSDVPTPRPSECPGHSAVVAAADASRGLRGDVDGDGRSVRVVVVTRRPRPLRCRYFLVVLGARAMYVHTIREGLIPAAMQRRVDGAMAWLTALAPIDRRAGAEIVVTLDRGAASSGVGVYTARGRRLVPMRVVRPQPNPRGLFWEWNSGGRVGVVDCVARSRGVVAETSVAHDPPRLSMISRDVYVVRDTTFRLTTTRHARRASLPKYPELRAAGRGAFATCRIAPEPARTRGY